MLRQFPTEFEYKEELLAFLAEEAYSCLHGANFAYDSELQRGQAFEGLCFGGPKGAADGTAAWPGSVGCVWAEVELQRARFVSPFFKRPGPADRDGQGRRLPLRPRVTPDAIGLWDSMYGRGRQHAAGGGGGVLPPRRSALAALEEWAAAAMAENARLSTLLASRPPLPPPPHQNGSSSRNTSPLLQPTPERPAIGQQGFGEQDIESDLFRLSPHRSSGTKAPGDADQFKLDA